MKDTEQNLNQIIEEAYKTTLGPWHGWIASAAYKVMQLYKLPVQQICISIGYFTEAPSEAKRKPIYQEYIDTKMIWQSFFFLL
jgi:Glycolipid transfer protein (GLTP)